MVEIPLLEPAVLLETVRQLPTDDDFVMLNRIRREDWADGQTVNWEILQGSSQMGRPNVPNSEAHIVPTIGRRRGQASFLYYREKEVLHPSFTLWVREPGGRNLQRAEDAVVRAVANLTRRMNNLMEYTIWAALKGRLVLDFHDVQADVDYQMPASHKPTPAVGWDTATPDSIIEDLTAWKTLISTHGRVPAREVYTTPNTLRLIVNAFLRENAASGMVGGALFTDRMREEYFSTGAVAGFMNMDWRAIDLTYQDADGALQNFVADNSLILGNFDQGQPIRFFEGRTADFDAPTDHVGPFTKTFREEDPSQQQVLMENSFIPIVQRPESFVYVADVTA
jgi:hypothetical protein